MSGWVVPIDDLKPLKPGRKVLYTGDGRMMRIKLIWIRGEYTWLEDAWADETATDQNHGGWLEAIEKARNVAEENASVMRIQTVDVPGVEALFADPPVVRAQETEA